MGFPWAPKFYPSLLEIGASQVVLLEKNPPVSTGDSRDMGSIPELGRLPWRRSWQPTPVFLPGEFHGWRSLVGYSPWGRKDSVMTEVTEPAHPVNEIIFHGLAETMI